MKPVFRTPLWRSCTLFALLACCALLAQPAAALAQGVTTGSLTGRVTDANQQPVAGAKVVATHVASGTNYETMTRADGRYSIPGMRVGGGYLVTVEHAGTGSSFEPQVQEDIVINLGVATDLDFIVRALAVEVTVTAQQSDAVFSSERTGAATTVSRETLATLPTISQRLQDITRLTPQAGGGGTFAGQDNRMNNITVDGSYFNNSFGLAGAPGDRTQVAPISLASIEQVQVSIAPFDVRQGNFIGAGINTVTRSGTNDYRGSLYYQFRDHSLVGTEAGPAPVSAGTFDYKNTGFWASGPIVRNRLFFFLNFEDETLESPGTVFRANAGGQTVTGNTTRVLRTHLDELSSFLNSSFGYVTGPYEGYPSLTPARRFLLKTDFNLNQRNKISFRYNHLDSDTDVLVSTSSSLGFGRGSSVSGGRGTQFLNFQNSNYQIMENIRSGIGEWNAILSDNMSNNLIVGYTTNDESRNSRGEIFPFVDILENATTYTSFGFEPFTPNNELRYNTFQLQNNFTRYGARHSLTFGGSYERYRSENVFFPGSQSAYVYNSLADFYADANGYLANPNRTTSPVTLRRFQVRWANIPGMEKPIQPLEVQYVGAYAQDDWRLRDNVRVTAGIRFDVPYFEETGFANPNADGLTFRDEHGNPVQYSTAKLPDPHFLWSPRLGFNWDVRGERRTQVRGGTGIFTGKPAFVWISNQIGNTGVLTGFESLDNTTARPFNPDPNRYKPTNVTGAPASSYELALTDPDFRFPQLWRTNLAVDHRLPWGLTGTAEFIYGRDVNGIYYINANLPAPQSAFAGADNRPRWVGTPCSSAGNVGGCVTRINSEPGNVVQNAIVMKNQNVGRSWDTAFSLEKQMAHGFWAKGAYRYGESKNTVNPGSIAFGSWNGNPHASNPNTPGLGYSFDSPGHRVFLAASYRREYFNFGGTTVSIFWEAFHGSSTYTFAGDANGDGGTGNDLLYIPRNTGEMNFEQFTTGGRTFTAAEQAAAWDAYISQDKYLSSRRGQYAERGAVNLPMTKRMDLSLAQDVFTNLGGRRHGFQFRADVLNFTNMLNKNWGLGHRMVNSQPLTNPSVDPATGALRYRMRVINGELQSRSTERTASLSDVWRVQFSLRYNFN